MKADQVQAIIYVAVGAVVAIACFVHWLLARKRGPAPVSPDRRRHAARKERRANPYSLREGELAVAFRVGGKYYNSAKNRVFKCIALKGKRARRVAFGCLDSSEKDLEFLVEHKVRTDGGIETCERGAFRANRPATEQEIAAEWDFLRRLRKREAEYKPDGSVRLEITVGDKTYTSR